MNISFSDKITPAKRTSIGKIRKIFNKIFNNTLLFLLCSLLYMTLPQLVFFLLSKSFHYDYGVKEGLYWLIVGLFLWADTFVISRIEKGKSPLDGLFIDGFICGLMLIYQSTYYFIMLYQHMQTHCI